MEAFIRINFWIVIFCFPASFCFPTASPPIGDINDFNIKMMRNEVKCEENSRFYTPTNIKPECFTAALQCFKDELQTVTQECSNTYATNQTQEGLEDLINERKKTELKPAVCSCEGWSEEPFPSFLNAMQSLLERILPSAPGKN